jgi:hypothetical protein
MKWVGGCPGLNSDLDFSKLPLDLQLHILSYAPLAALARMATVSKYMLAVYKERLQERQACMDANLAEGWPAETTEGLSPADMAVPRDLVVSPPVSPLCMVPSHLPRLWIGLD